MATSLNPYLNFKDNAREAMEFYQSIFGRELTIMKFSDLPMGTDPSEGDKVMHSSLKTDTMTLMGADTPNGMPFEPAAGTSLMVGGRLEDADTLRGWWAKLSDGAEIKMPLEKAPWGDYFGMLVDRFGTPWMFDYGEPQGG
jgi:PhnB protein